MVEEYAVENVGMAAFRKDYDEDVVDCSNRIFEVTTMMMSYAGLAGNVTIFPSRRWLNFREGDIVDRLPDRDHPLLYLGNPIRIFFDPKDGITVERLPEFLIKSGMELGY